MTSAPLTLITGLPGQGKSLLAVSKVDEWFPDRPIYYHNIKDLQKPWIPLDNPELWYELPVGSVIVMDECQDVFPIRSGKQGVPEKCSKFERLRHSGHNVVLITQKPRQIDIHVRELVGCHIHLQRMMGTNRAVTFTWPKVCEAVDDERERAKAEKGIFEYPKQSFNLYKSAEVHTIKRRIPLPILFIPVAVAAVGGMGYWAYHTLIGKRTQPVEQVVKDESSLVHVSKSEQLGYLDARKPIITGLPHTAPAYAEIIRPQRAPYPAACVASASRCTCYTQDATIMDVQDSLCRHISKNGFFKDWLDKGGESQPASDSGGGLASPPPTI